MLQLESLTNSQNRAYAPLRLSEKQNNQLQTEYYRFRYSLYNLSITYRKDKDVFLVLCTFIKQITLYID